MKVSCPQCGNKVFKTPSEPKSIDDFIGSVCSKCGYRLTDDDIKGQALNLAENLMRDAFKGAKFKK